MLSPSTEDYDRGKKFQHYRPIPTLQDYLVLAQDRPRVEHYARQAEHQWLLQEYADPAETIHLTAVDCALAVAALYEKVGFAEAV